MRVKDDSVNIAHLSPAVFWAAQVFEDRARVLYSQAYEATITEGYNTGGHSFNSAHYKNLAVDLRSKDIPANLHQQLLDEVRERIGVDFDLLLERPGEDHEHFHLECDPKRR